jgi:hypothetical protein
MVTALLGLAAVLAGCEGFYLATPIPQTWVGIQGPRGCVPPEEMSLEIDGSTWSLNADACDRVVTLQTGQAVQVNLWGVSTCRFYTSFEAPPGSLHLIVFLDDGSIRIDDETGQGIEMGPSLGERAPTGCEVPA